VALATVDHLHFSKQIFHYSDQFVLMLFLVCALILIAVDFAMCVWKSKNRSTFDEDIDKEYGLLF